MARTAIGLLAIASGLLTGAHAQLEGWISGQVNTTMCYWEQPRANVMRDTLYMDGGSIYWKPGMDDGSDVGLSSDSNPLGIMFTLNFSQPFNTSDNITALFGQLAKGSTDTGTTNIAPNYFDGAMFSNQAEILLFGGLLSDTDGYTQPSGSQGLYYQAYLYGVERTFIKNFGQYELPDGMNRYIAYGGAADAPSEYKSWYFTGMHSPIWSNIYESTTNISNEAVNISSTLITLDTTSELEAVWTNDTLPDSVSGRANPELVWVPVGEEGILVAIGGVTYPEFITVYHESTNETGSKAESPVFMTTIDVYDVANETWYKQTTTGGGPGQLTRACAVVATAADSSSFNIYSYGGYDGLNITGDFNDDVWVLSLPSFTWTQVYAGTASHGRAGQRCVLPYPDQMFVVGGYTSMATSEPCLEDNILQVFNLSSAEWLTSYDPEVWSNYTVPTAVVDVIGGNGQGSATATQPAATGGWDSDALGQVFSTAYAKSIPTYYPYTVAAATNTTSNSTASETATSKKHSVPKFLPPLLGVICGLMVVSLAVVGFVLYRKRKLLRRGSQTASRRSSRGINGAAASDASTYDTRRNAIAAWLRDISSVKRVPTSTVAASYDDAQRAADVTPISPEMEHVHGVSPQPVVGHSPLDGRDSPAVEAPNTFIAEMMADTHHPRAELSADLSSNVSSSRLLRREKGGSAELESHSSKGGRTHSKTARRGAVTRSGTIARPDSPSLGSEDAMGKVSLPSSNVGTPSPPPMPTSPITRSTTASSPTPGPSAPSGTSSGHRGHESGVSDLSETDRRHLRQSSEGGQSSVSGVSVVSPATPQVATPLSAMVGPSQPVGRPHPILEVAAAEEAAEVEGSIPRIARLQPVAGSPTSSNSGSPATGRRQSIFRESREDMNS